VSGRSIKILDSHSVHLGVLYLKPHINIMSEAVRNYLPVQVISGDSETKSGQNDVDRHNKPRLRRSIIISALAEKYSHLTQVRTAPVASNCDLVDIYSSVHDSHMVQFLVDAWSEWKKMGPEWYEECSQPGWEGNGPPPFIPCHAAFRRDGIERVSRNVMGAFGYYCTDNMTPIVESLVTELQEDASIICEAVNLALLKSSVVYAVTTHPGHHSNFDNFGGYCYLNNAALGARLMQKRLDDDMSNSRVAIIDIDYHCGNGTASIFYRDPNVFFTSIHCDPEIEYPFNAGYEDQIGEGAGKGTTLHIPLAAGATWCENYKPALEKAMNAIMEFNVGGLVVSMGLDTYKGDSVSVSKGGFKLSGDDYYKLGEFMGSYMKEKFIPTVFVQEGGYKMDVVGEAAADVLGGFSEGVVKS
jgi:acetoin utilization deacetylase AcuC-like enzyme